MLLLVLALLLMAPAAGAATVDSPDGVAVNVADPGSEANNLSIVFDRGRQTLTVTDPGASLHAAGSRCQGGGGTVECFIRDSLSLTVEAGGGDDRVSANVESAVIDGGRGDDTLIGGDGPDMLDGGEGDDTFRAGGGSDDIRAYDGPASLGGDSIGCGGGADGVQSFDPEDVVGAGCEGAFVEGVRLTPPALRAGRIRLTIGPGSDFDHLPGNVRVRVPATGRLLGSGAFGPLGRRELTHRLSLTPTAEGRRYLRQPHPLVRVAVTFRGRRGGTFSMLAEAR